MAQAAASIATEAFPVEHARPSSPITLSGIFRRNKWQIIATYSLFSFENVLRLTQPMVVGWAINDLLDSSYRGLMWFVAQHVTHLAIGMIRQMYDTRAFTAIYTDLATQIVKEQRVQGIAVSRVAARSTMSRNYVEFFEQYVPMVIRALYSVVGVLVMLAFFDVVLVAYCLGLIVPAFWLNFYYSRKTLALSAGLHDEFEREVQVIDHGDEKGVREHFATIARWRVRLSDAEAINFSLMEFFILGVLLLSLMRFCTSEAPRSAGEIFAAFRYMLMFVMGIDAVPRLVQQLSRLRDIGSRVTNLPKDGDYHDLAGQ